MEHYRHLICKEEELWSPDTALGRGYTYGLLSVHRSASSLFIAVLVLAVFIFPEINHTSKQNRRSLESFPSSVSQLRKREETLCLEPAFKNFPHTKWKLSLQVDPEDKYVPKWGWLPPSGHSPEGKLPSNTVVKKATSLDCCLQQGQTGDAAHPSTSLASAWKRQHDNGEQVLPTERAGFAPATDLHFLAVDIHWAHGEVDADGVLLLLAVLPRLEAVHYAGLSHVGVPNQDDLEEVVEGIVGARARKRHRGSQAGLRQWEAFCRPATRSPVSAHLPRQVAPAAYPPRPSRRRREM